VVAFCDFLTGRFTVQPLAKRFYRHQQISFLEVGRYARASPMDRFHHPSDTTGPPGIFDRRRTTFAHTIWRNLALYLMIAAIVPGKPKVIQWPIYDHVEAIEYTQVATGSWRYLVVFLVCGVGGAAYSLNGRVHSGDDGK